MLTCLSLGPGTSGIFSFGFVKNRSTIIYTEKKNRSLRFNIVMKYCGYNTTGRDFIRFRWEKMFLAIRWAE